MPTEPPGVTDEDACLDALREAARRLGRSPTKAEYEELGLTPASATVVRTLGSWNDAKEAAGLSTNPSSGSRVDPPPDGVSEEIRDRWTELSVDQRWHYRNVEWNTERTRRRRTERRKWVDNLKAAEGCEECGVSDPVVLEYHHRDSEEKQEKVSQLVITEASRERIRAEIDSCDVLCANCHRAKHVSPPEVAVDIDLRKDPVRLVAEEPNGETFEVTTPKKRRSWVNSYKEARGCAKCGNDDGATLDLHHVDDDTKALTVSRLVSEGYGTERVYRELKKCEVLYANCHRKHHHSA
jgi:hypothetical protein